MEGDSALMPKLSAGLLPYRFADDGSLRVLLVHPGGPFWKNKDAQAWSIPKGEYQEGEDPERAADREFEEELGLPVPDGPRIDLGTIRQASGKYVRAWAVLTEHLATEEVVSNRFEMEWPPKSGTMREFPEVDRAQWMTVGDARTRLVAAQVELVDRLAAALREDLPVD
jgi:predicted NUDIX family NTP pyrophosphohydrolase